MQTAGKRKKAHKNKQSCKYFGGRIVNRKEQQQIDDILGLWISCQSKHESINSIIMGGPTVGGKWLEYKGSFPQLSSFNIDAMSGKVDKMRKFEFSTDERLAYMIIGLIPDERRKILVSHREMKNKNNAETNSKWTHADIAAWLGYDLERYYKIRNNLAMTVIETFNYAKEKKRKMCIETQSLKC